MRPLLDRAVERLASLAQERNMLISTTSRMTWYPRQADGDLIVR